MLWRAQAGHPGGSLSAAEILTVLYFGAMRIDPTRPDWADRDRFVLSKGHAAPIYYATLAERGYFSPELLTTYDELDSMLQAHPFVGLPGIDTCSGSLGQGLSVGIGMALGARLKGSEARVFVLLGDGELQEGQVWEAAMAASSFGLDSLTAIVDANRLQLYGTVESIVSLEPLPDKWRAFGWNVLEVDGHDCAALAAALCAAAAPEITGRPTVIIAHTTKGKGVSFMENSVEWHSAAVTDELRERALAELVSGAAS
ncbi:MAG: transketolase [Actinobacteria bacterium]|nr:transketolase [Actinomycetota bacterium]